MGLDHVQAKKDTAIPLAAGAVGSRAAYARVAVQDSVGMLEHRDLRSRSGGRTVFVGEIDEGVERAGGSDVEQFAAVVPRSSAVKLAIRRLYQAGEWVIRK